MQAAANRVIAVAALLAAISSAALHAHLPPSPPREYSAYGPFQLCSNRFVIDVKVGEALHVVGDIVRIISDEQVLAIKYADDPNWFAKENGSLEPLQQGSFRAVRFHDPFPDSGNVSRYAPHGLGKDDVRYALYPKRGGEALLVGATSFNSSSQDDSLLRRIRPGVEQDADCMPLWHAISNFTDGDIGQRVRPNQYQIAGLFPPEPDEGPVFHCMAGIGMALETGESLQRPWRSLGYDGPVHVRTKDSVIKLEQRGEPMRRVDPGNQQEHPMNLMNRSSIVYYPSRGVGPPYAATGVREDGSWQVTLNSLGARSIEISFPASAKTGAGFNFLERLQYVEPGDPRCGSRR